MENLSMLFTTVFLKTCLEQPASKFPNFRGSADTGFTHNQVVSMALVCVLNELGLEPTEANVHLLEWVDDQGNHTMISANCSDKGLIVTTEAPDDIDFLNESNSAWSEAYLESQWEIPHPKLVCVECVEKSERVDSPRYSSPFKIFRQLLNDTFYLDIYKRNICVRKTLVFCRKKHGAVHSSAFFRLPSNVFNKVLDLALPASSEATQRHILGPKLFLGLYHFLEIYKISICVRKTLLLCRKKHQCTVRRSTFLEIPSDVFNRVLDLALPESSEATKRKFLGNYDPGCDYDDDADLT